MIRVVALLLCSVQFGFAWLMDTAFVALAGDEVLVTAPAAVAPAAPQESAATPVEAQSATQTRFSSEQLEQLIAPIALYPDALLAHVLMASTYPLEIVEAARFVQANPNLKGEALEEALKDEDWDPSVKALCGYPDLLARMNDNLDWMRDLGDAFLAQESELMDAAQKLRQIAFDAGTLATTPEQTVTVTEERIIVIEPANPRVVYVPWYYPTVVYRGWGYPVWYYPGLYLPPPPRAPPFVFHVGFWAGPPPLWGRCHWRPHASRVDVDVHVHNQFVTRIDRRPITIRAPGETAPRAVAGGRTPWQHDPTHRRGITYRQPDLAKKFQQRPATTKPPAPRFDRDDVRGRGGRELDRERARLEDRRGQFNTWSGARNPALDREASRRGRESLRGRGDRPRPTSPPRVVRPPSRPRPPGGN